MRDQIESEKKYKFTVANFNSNFEGYQKDIVNSSKNNVKIFKGSNFKYTTKS